MAPLIDPRVSRFYQLASRDDDDLKRFLYFFLAIEIEVHRVFKATPRSKHIENAATLAHRVADSLARLLESRDENWNSLADRFIWCVVSTWGHLTDRDVTEFKRLKKLRDSIAHGEVSTVPKAAVIAAENLSRRIHSPSGT
jgi:hypothetical protein